MATKRNAGRTSRATAANAVGRQLNRYREMRDFKVTSEPSGEAGVTKTAGGRSSSQRRQLPFVIQKHAASRLHYDFRLGWNGVLKSWAIAKGPSYFPGDKRLAVQVEDHPIEYGGFEGIIPKGQYGGGTVMLWDQGTWEPQAGHTDIDEGFRRGSLKFTLHGTKMKGNWTLVRMGGKAANERKPNWLLIKEHDGFERSQQRARCHGSPTKQRRDRARSRPNRPQRRPRLGLQHKLQKAARGIATTSSLRRRGNLPRRSVQRSNRLFAPNPAQRSSRLQPSATHQRRRFPISSLRNWRSRPRVRPAERAGCTS